MQRTASSSSTTAITNLPPFDAPASYEKQRGVVEAAYHINAVNTVREAASVSYPSSYVFQMAAMLARLLEEIDRGPLTTIENHENAVTFNDFLDHGAEYLKHGRKNEAAIIAGIVFEDTVRHICRVLGVTENSIALDTLISELAKRDPPVLTALKAKRARAAARPRYLGGMRSASATWPGD